MTEQIMKLLKSSNEEDNVIGLMLFKKTKATQKELCMYLQANRSDNERHYSLIASKYFKNAMYSSRPHMRIKWKRLLK